MAKNSSGNGYGNQSISSLKGADRVRKRPAVIFGSDGLEGCEHSVFEIVSNAVDEAKEGYGDVIRITVFKDESIEVEDSGRGVPLDYNEAEGKYNWELVFCELYAGGKYNNNDDESAYKFSLGLNGLGACATQYSSEFFDVKSYSGGKVYEMHFQKGEPIGELQIREKEKKEKASGTIIRWKPDYEVFTDIKIPYEYYDTMLKKQAVVNAKLRFVFSWQKEDGSFETKEYFYENGIEDYVVELSGNTSLTQPVLWKLSTSGRDRDDKDDYKLKAEISFCVSNQVNILEYYHNSSFLEHGGSPDKAVRSAFLYGVDKYLKSTGKYGKKDDKIQFCDIEDCLILVINSFSTQTSYANQTKKAITNTFITEALTAFMKEQLEIYFAENPTEADKIATQVMINKKSRETAETTRVNIKKKLAGTIDMTNRIEKFVNCRSKDPNVRELYIVEGDSALTSCKLARSSDFQAIIPVRGKTLNCMKSTYDKIFNNDIIVDLIRLIGCGVELKGKVKGDMVPFDLSALKWSKIILCTDADEDGFQIRTLLLTMFYSLLPTLLKEGKVFIAESPLFEINTKTDTYFAYNEREKVEILKQIGDTKCTIQRSKGLGENEPDMMRRTTMDPATRRLIQVTPDDEQKTLRMFETLLGDDLEERKKFVAMYGKDYLKLADI